MTPIVEAPGRSLLRRRIGRAPRALVRRLARALVLLTALGCSVSHFDGQTYRNGAVAFRLQQIPARWRPIEVSTAALAFRDDDGGATVAVNGRCGKDADDVPLRSLTQHLFIQFTERKLQEQEILPLDGREALRTRMVAKLDGVPKYFHVVVLKKDGCVYDFWQIAHRRLDPNDFLHFVQGFSTLG